MRILIRIGPVLNVLPIFAEGLHTVARIGRVDTATIRRMNGLTTEVVKFLFFGGRDLMSSLHILLKTTPFLDEEFGHLISFHILISKLSDRCDHWNHLRNLDGGDENVE